MIPGNKRKDKNAGSLLRADGYDRSGWDLGGSWDFLCSRWFPAVQAQRISTISGTDVEWPFLQWDFAKAKREKKACCKAPSTLSFWVSCTLSSRYWLIWGSVQKKNDVYNAGPISAQLSEQGRESLHVKWTRKGKSCGKARVVRFKMNTYTNLAKYKSVLWQNQTVTDPNAKRRQYTQ
jgi:hypothetical protein